MKYVYFVRHSIRDFTIKEDREAPLTEEGVKLANGLTLFFLNYSYFSLKDYFLLLSC